MDQKTSPVIKGEIFKHSRKGHTIYWKMNGKVETSYEKEVSGLENTT